MYQMYKMSETKSDTALGFMKSNQTYIRIAIEIIVILLVCYYFTSKNSSVLKHVENVSQRLEELEDGTNEQISKLSEMNNKLINEINVLKQQLQSTTQIQTESRKRKMENTELDNPFSVQPPYQQRQPSQQPFQPPYQQRQPPQQTTQPPQQTTQLKEIKSVKLPEIPTDEKASGDKHQVIINDEESDQVKTVSEYNNQVEEEDLDEALKNELAELDE